VVEIEAGLNPGERVIVGNTRAVNSGDRINLTGSSQP